MCLHMMWCVSSGWFVVAAFLLLWRDTVQGSLQKDYWRLAYTFGGLSSWLHGDEHDSRKAGLVLEQSGAESLHMIYKWQAEREREKPRLAWPDFWNLKVCYQCHTSSDKATPHNLSRDSSAIEEPSIQGHEPAPVIFIHTSTGVCMPQHARGD